MSSPIERLFKVKISSKGQVVIPKPIRDAYNFKEGDEVLMIPLEDGILMRKFERSVELRGLLKGLDVDVTECERILMEAKKSLLKGI